MYKSFYTTSEKEKVLNSTTFFFMKVTLLQFEYLCFFQLSCKCFTPIPFLQSLTSVFSCIFICLYFYESRESKFSIEVRALIWGESRNAKTERFNILIIIII